MRVIIWGFGLLAFLSLVLIALFALRFVSLKFENEDLNSPEVEVRAHRWEGMAFLAAWLVWALFFTWNVAVGSIHRQERAYVFVAILGLVAVAALLGEIGWKFNPAVLASLAGAGVLLVMSLAETWTTRFDLWEHALPDEAAEVGDYLLEHSGTDNSVLFGWMWWHEWRAALFATDPSQPDTYCLYFRCRRGESRSAQDLVDTSELDEATERRMVEAASFILEVEPKHIVVFSEARHAAWDAHPGSYPAFVRPLLAESGDCWTTIVNDDEYCPVLTNDLYVVLERS